MAIRIAVTTAEAGVRGACNGLKRLDSGVRRNDGRRRTRGRQRGISFAERGRQRGMSFAEPSMPGRESLSNNRIFHGGKERMRS